MLIGNLRFPGLPSWLSLIPRTAMSWDWQKEMEVSFALLSRPGRSAHCSKSSFKFRVIWIVKCRISSVMSFRTLPTTWNSAVKDIFIPPCAFYNCGLLGRRQVSWEADSTGEKRLTMALQSLLWPQTDISSPALGRRSWCPTYLFWCFICGMWCEGYEDAPSLVFPLTSCQCLRW